MFIGFYSKDKFNKKYIKIYACDDYEVFDNNVLLYRDDTKINISLSNVYKVEFYMI